MPQPPAPLSGPGKGSREPAERGPARECRAHLLSSDARILSGRPRGAQLRGTVEERLQQEPAPCLLPLDFGGVEFVDVSCADELLEGLLARVTGGDLGARLVLAQGMNASVRDTVNAVLQLRERALIVRDAAGVAVLGHLQPPLLEALSAVPEGGRITSPELAEVLGRNLNIACNRLNALVRHGLVWRWRDAAAAGGGRQYTYESLV